ncbi:hypothetical protein LAZ67_2005063, partial [Cordylochernes scorpioides]
MKEAKKKTCEKVSKNVVRLSGTLVPQVGSCYPIWTSIKEFSPSRSLNDEKEETVWSKHEAKVVHTLEWKKSIIVNGKEICFKLDSGAEVNVLPYTFTRQMKGLEIFQTNRKLTSYTGHEIKIKGIATLNCKTKNKTESLEFFIADGYYQPILGIEAIEKLSLIKKCDAVQIQQNNSAKEILNRHKNIFEGIGRLPIEHKIRLNENTTPVIASSRKIPFSIREKVKAELERMEKLDIIEKVEEPSEWTHPIVVVQKPSGDVRICMDPRELNKYIQRERYILPTAETIFSELKGATVFSVFNASSAFWQVPLDKESTNLCTIATPFGRFRFKRLPYGLNSASEVFQRCINNILSGLQGTACYMDDILIYGSTMEEHNRNLETVLRRLEENNVKLNAKKQQIAVDKVNFLGHIISRDGIAIQASRAEAIQKFKRPENKTEVQRFLGMVTYLGKFIPNLSDKTAPLRKLISNKSEWKFGGEENDCFEKLKDMVSNAPVLRTCKKTFTYVFPHDAAERDLACTGESVVVLNSIQPPETFDFSTPNEWPKWRKRFERYLVVSGMKKKEEADKIDLFMYLMGDRADDIFRTFKFEKEEEATKIDSVLKAFDSHFCVRKNIIYERAKFNSRIQEDREPVDEFITSLYKLADSCEFEGLHEQLIRDRIVVGVRDKALSERMQLDSELTLEKAVKMVRQQEAVRQQQVDLQRPSTSQKVNQVKFNSKKQSPKQQQQPSRKKEKSAKTRSRCPKCGGFTHREGQACRAEGQKCNLCSKTGHFANCCPDKQAKTAEVKVVSELDEEIGFLLEVSAAEDSSNLDDDEGECRRRWTAEIQVNGKKVKFKLDSQADVTCVPLCLFKKIMGQQRLVKSDINLRAAEFSELQTVVLRKLKEAKVTLNKAKCVFGVPRINFLGHILDEDGIRPDPAKIEAVAKMPAPTDVHGVRRFLGMVNHLGRFVENLSEIVAPLNQLLVKGQDFVWDCSQERAFRRLKELLTTQPILAAYDVRKPTMVSSDASSYGLGAVLKQEGKNGIWLPVAYSSRTMTPTEKRYAQIEKEALAITWACERFQDFLLGKRFRIETDHKPLIPLFSTKELSSLTPRLQRFRMRMMSLKKGDVLRTCKKTFTYVFPRDAAERDLACTGESVVVLNSVWMDIKTAPILTFFDPTKPITISSDASQYGIGTVLMQGGHAIEYASFSLNATQRKYAQIEKELLAIVFGCERFQYYIWGNYVIVETDHKPLLSIVKKPLEKLSPRLQRMVLRLMRFQISLKFTPGKNMFVADHLSRDPLKDEVDTSYLEGQTESVHMLLVTTDEKIKRLQKETHGDHTLIQLIEYAKNGWPKYKTKVCEEAKPYWQFQDEIHVSDGIVYKGNCIMVPSTLRKEILQVVHSPHQGIAASKEKARSAFYWPGMITQVENEVEKCRTCQEFSIKNPEESRIAHEIPEFPWEKIAVDFMEVSGTSSILVVDYHSKYVEIRKLSSKRETETIMQLKTIFRTHGIPRTLVSDNGPPFNSTGFKNFAQKYEFKHQTSSPKYPRSNGQVERTIQTIKGLIIKAVKSGRDPNLALMEFNNTPKYDLPSPTQMLMGRSVRTLSTYTPDNRSPKRILRPLEVGDNIMLQERHRKWVPATVTAKHETPRSYMVKTPSGSEYRRCRSHLRPRKFSVEDSAPTIQSPSIPGSQAGTAMDDNIQDHGRPTSENRRAYDPREDVAKKGEESSTSPSVRTRSGRTTGSTTQWQADLAPKEMAASDLRNRCHVQPLLTWSTDSSCIPGSEALTGYYQHGQLNPAVVSNLNLRKMETENKTSDTSEICKVSVKIPPFWVEKPEIWFFQVEAQFKIGGFIQEDTKFNYLISQLEPKYIENIWDIINMSQIITSGSPMWCVVLLVQRWLRKSLKVSVQLERVGKLQPADRVATNSSAGIQDCRNLRLFVTDKNTGLRFLVDSGADISIIPPKDKNRMPSSDYKLYAANGTEIVTYGTKVRNLDIGLRRQFQWPFVIANTNRAIIGADFLNNFGLIIDIKNKRLIDGITNLSIRGVIQSISDMGNISTLNSSSKVRAILTKYPNLCRPPSDFVEAKHSVKHYIPTRGQPIHSKARRLDSQRLTLAKAEFQYMLNNGIIRPSNSPWASPLHLVSKKDESLRPCGDYRRLNAVTLPDRYPIPRLDDFHHILKGTRVYSKIDLCKAFYQIPIAEEDKPKTAIITPFGLFEFNVMSFGLRNATATFQRFMHEVLRNLDFAFVYLDDILVASKTEEEHYSHLETLFSRLNSYGLRINLSKSKFQVQEIDFLGYLITSHGVKPLPTKVKAILEYKKPKTVHELRIFLGMLNFYRTFLNNAAETQAILHEYLRGAKKKDRSEIKWTKEAEVQFEKCKQALANTALLAYPDTELPISLCTDASDRAVGSVLQQLDNNNWKPIAFFSKKLNPAQCNYSTYDRELLAIYLSIKFFKHLLEAREFTILTDHKPLIYAFKQKNEKASPRQLRHLQYISQFSTDIKYIKGTDNIVADALSRVDAITTIDYEEIAKEQTGDSELQNLISKNTSLKFKQCPLQSGNLLWCDVSTNNIRPFIPIKFRMMVFRNFHELSHPGIKATTKQLTSRFIWPNMNKDIRKWAQACVNCQKCKVSIHTKSEIGKYQEVDERFSVVHIDLIGALPPSNGNIYCLTCIDRYTSWMEVVPLPDIKSETVARAFYENWIVRFGAPHTVISDRGKQFTSQLFKDLTTLCGIKLRHSTAYHPQCNGKIERLHRTIKTAIRAHNSIKWTETLPTVLLGLRAAINKDTNHSLSQMVYGKTIRLPGEFFDDSKHHLHAEEFVQQLQKQMELLKPLNEKHHSKTKVFVHKDLKICSHVFIRTDRVKKPLEPPYEGPFPVLERTDKYFTLKVKGKNVTTSIDRLRPAYLLADSDNITAEHPTAARPIVSGVLPSTSSQQNPDPPDVEKYTEFQGTGSAPDLPRTRSGRIIKKP